MSLTVLHLTWYRFGRRHHPATWQMIVGLARHFRTVVLNGDCPGYFADDGYYESPRPSEAAIEVHSHPELHALRHPELAASLATTLQRRWGPIDAVVGHLSCGALAVHLARQLRVPVLAVFHGDDANIELESREFGLDYARLRSAPTACFLGVSRNLVERLIAFGMPAERTYLHHLGVNLTTYQALERREVARPIRIVMAAWFRPSKGHEMAIRGFAELVRSFPYASLDFFGDADTPDQRRIRDQMIALADRLGLASAVSFRGPVGVEVLAKEFANFDIAIQTSVSAGQVEGVPNAIVEAMATALPFVATRHGGIPEAVLDERTGLLVREHDHEGLGRALARLAGDRELRIRYGIAGRKWIEREFDSIRQSDRLADRVREMVKAYASFGGPERETGWRW